jgi:oligosaccharide repeat unit polymerase
MKKYFSIDHKILFVTGYAFYLFTPFIVGYTNLFQGFPGIELYKGFFNAIPDKKINAYLWITFSWLPAFFIGHYLFSLLKPYKLSLQKFPANFCTKNINLIAGMLFLALLVFVFLGRNSLFGGYATYDTGARGKFSSLLIIFNFFLIYQLLSKQQLSWLLLTGCLITAFLLLSMGGRMYVFQTFIVFLVYKTSFAEKRWKPYQIATVVIIGFLVGSLSGIWRMGQNFNLSKASYSFLAEPVFTWFSTSTFLIDNQIPLFNFPSNFLTSFFNLIPNTVISLQPYVVSTQDMGYTYQSPLGADSLWTTLVINFGSIGSFLFILITGFFLNFLRHNAERTRFGAVYYIMVCGILPFQFFRDGFYIINKQLFFNFLVLPGLILIALKFLQQTLQLKQQEQ